MAIEFQGPPMGFMDMLRAKYAIMQQEANSRGALQGAQTAAQVAQTEWSPALAAAQLQKMGAETGLEGAKTDLTAVTTADARRNLNPPPGVSAAIWAAMTRANPGMVSGLEGLGYGGPKAGTPSPLSSLPSYGGPGIFSTGQQAPSGDSGASMLRRMQQQPNYWGQP